MSQWKCCVFRILVLTCIFAVAGIAQAKAPPEARKHLEAGLAYHDDPAGPRYEEAYREFHAAYAIYPAYQILANIGTCALYLERDAEAIDAYERYLKEAQGKDIPPKKRALMESDIKTLKASLVTIAVETSPARLTLIDERFASKGQVIVNRYEVTNGAITLGIHPGSHRLTAHWDGYEDQRWEFDAASASTHEHKFKLAAPKATSAEVLPPKAEVQRAALVDVDSKGKKQPRMRSTPATVYVGLAATTVFAGAATGLGLMATSSKNTYLRLNDGEHIDEARDAYDDTKRNLLLTDIALGAAVVSAGVTAYLYFSRPYAMEKSPKLEREGWRLLPLGNTRLAGLSLSGKF